ncbi:MAG: GNAT family N-acetyltransferase [Bacteroidales bacterium]|nr:GNAT family N-acetyltransferase [Bacteroidales bacterium]
MVKIRIAAQEDLVRIVEIYNQAIPSQRSTGYISLLTVDDIQGWFNRHKPDFYPIFLAEKDGKVVGWNSVSAYREKRLAFRFCAETSYYIDKDYHRQGIATQLLEHVIKECNHLQVKTLIAYILEHNQPSIGLMEKFGFEKWATLPNIADFDGKEVAHTIYGKRIY